MTQFKLNTAVAFIIFNRPDTTERVFAEIAKAKPPKLLVVGDGARVGREGEAEKVAATRAIIDLVDWSCEVLTNYSDINLGCKDRVSSGIDWVFKQVPEAIILEDDCLPDSTFFRFCQEMLEKYRDEKRVGMISGGNFQFAQSINESSYYFSKYCIIWGWASWRDRWVGYYDSSMYRWPELSGEISNLVKSEKESNYWANIFNRTFANEIDTWDYQWFFANLVESRLTVSPSVNLISNIGCGIDATHTKTELLVSNLPSMPISFPLLHPSGIVQNIKADKLTNEVFFDFGFKIMTVHKLLNVWAKLKHIIGFKRLH